MVARSGKAPEDMVFWYNNSPNSQGVVPAAAVFQYDVRIPGETSLPKSTNHPDSGSYEVWDAVYVNPLNTKYTDV